MEMHSIKPNTYFFIIFIGQKAAGCDTDDDDDDECNKTVYGLKPSSVSGRVFCF